MKNSLFIEPELRPVIDALPDLAMHDISIGRKNLEQAKQQLAEAGTPMNAGDPRLRITERKIPGPAGAPDIAVRIYTPINKESAAPGFVLYHGGAFVFGDLDSEHQRCLRLAAEGGAVVINVDYRLAPENPFPAGVEDCYAALQWTADNANVLGIDTARIAVGGGSAGGALAAAVALLSRDRHGPEIAMQMLLNPVIDDRMDTPSMVAGKGLPVWDSDATRQMWNYYLKDKAAGESTSPYAAPGRSTDLSNLPSAYVLTAEHDPLRDEAIIYATRLLQAGVPTELHQMPGTVHGFDLLSCGGIADRALDLQVAAFKKAMQTD